MSAHVSETLEGSDTVPRGAHREVPRPGSDPEFPDWHPDLNGPTGYLLVAQMVHSFPLLLYTPEALLRVKGKNI
jgi:hypothetical protein